MTTDGKGAATRDAACPACMTVNDRLQTRCTHCGAYLRDRIATLHLFAASWNMIERPTEGLRNVARSEQKNYMLLLFTATGPTLVMAAFAIMFEAAADVSYPAILAVLGLGGPLVGLAFGLLLSVAAWAMLSLTDRAQRWRTVAALQAYSMLPLVITSVVMVPVLIAVFGETLFGGFMLPWELHPLTFWSLAVMSACLVLWHFILAGLTLRVLGYGRAAASLGGALYAAAWTLLLACFGFLVAALLPAVREIF